MSQLNQCCNRKIAIKVPQVDEYHDLVYSQVKGRWDTQELKMSLLVPRTEQLKPAVLYLPGGGFTEANLHKLIQLKLVLAEAGVVVASATYRTIPANLSAMVTDAKQALAYLYQQAAVYRIDPNKIAVIGDSAGGYLAQLLGTISQTPAISQTQVQSKQNQVAAVVSLYGFSNLLLMGADPKRPEFDPAAPTMLMLNGVSLAPQKPLMPAEITERARQASPLFKLHSGIPPFLLMHGDADQLVPLAQTQDMATAMRQAGLDAKEIILTGAGHGTAEWYQPEVAYLIRDWLLEKLDWDSGPLDLKQQTTL